MIRKLLMSMLVLLPLAAAADDPVASASAFTVADERDPGETKQKILSLMITSCDYGVQRLGEKKAPGRLVALHDDLQKLKGDALAGKTLHVTRYNIFYNNQAILRGMVYPQYNGIIPDLMKEHGVNCPIEKTHGGWFDPAKLEHPHSPIIVDVEATLDGKTVSTRIIHAPPEELPGNFKHPEEATELGVAMGKAAADLAAQIS